jgi:UDP-N-acetylmuramoyl-tripeptide--D-alanyl-D-alanine ligase
VRISVGQWTEAVQGRLIAPEKGSTDTFVSGVVHDSRAVRPGCCFVCIAGEHTDGHAFALQAAEAGAALILAERNPFGDTPPPAPVLIVPNSIVALGRAAAWARDRTKALVLGVTGTAGKTTLKEMLAAVFSVRGKTEKNPMNLNNQIGLPESMLNADSNAAYWIFEAGISQPQDMDELGAILRPDLAIVLNVGPGHVEGLGGKGVAAHKARLLAHLRPYGFGLINAAYPELVREAQAITPRIVFFSANGTGALCRAAYAGPCDEQSGRYRVWLDNEDFELTAPFRGAFWAENIAAVAAAAHLCGFSNLDIAAGIAACELPKQRYAASAAGNFLLIDDTYNSNPLSMQRMLEAAAERAGPLQLVLVLGEMLELGESSQAEHEKLGRRIAQSPAKAVFWRGGQADSIQAGLDAEGFRYPFIPISSPDEFIREFKCLNISEGIVLFKGSRSNRMEEMLAAFSNDVRLKNGTHQ